jgi:hypothetical protein
MKRIDSVFLALSFVIPAAIAHADAWDKKTTVNFSQPVEVPGFVLQPGKYVMKLVNFPADRHVVQFTNERENRVYASAMAVPAYRTEVSDKTVITFYEARAGQPEPIKTWFYPGDNFGQEFVYARGHFSEIAADTHETNSTRAPEVVAAQPPPPTAALSAPIESNAPVEVAQTAPPPPASQEAIAAPQTVAQNNPAPAPAGLPETASKLPEIALLGLLFVGGAMTARSLRRS